MHYRVIEAGRLLQGDAAQTGRKPTALVLAKFLSLKHPGKLFAVWKVTAARPDGQSVALYRDGASLVPTLAKHIGQDAARDAKRNAMAIGFGG